jgi:Ca-activated chloride channel family protein
MKEPIRNYKGIFLVLVIMASFLILFSSSCTNSGTTTGKSPSGAEETGTANTVKVDDWEITPNETQEKGGGTVTATTVPTTTARITARPAPTATPSPTFAPTTTVPAASQNIGLAAGGAKDINNFRENIKNDYLPLPTDVTYEGLFYDYYFDTGQAGECDKLFCPSYTCAVTQDPFSGEEEYYLAVGLNSGMKESDFQRKKLNLVVVLDISGSMRSPFNQYYYDQFGKKVEISDEDAGMTKIELATQSIVALLDHLNDNDRFGMVLFNNNAFLAKPMNLVGDTDMGAIKDHILEISAGGSTNLNAGMRTATELYDELTDVDPSEYENRIIFLTDAMPNVEDISKQGLLGITKDNADNGVYATFIGIGVDFNTELVEYITKIRGANYYSVHSSSQFKERLDDEFEYMVTPLVFNLRLTLEADGWNIEKVYGSPEASEVTGELMKVNTLFPSKQEEGETRGSLILLKLHRNGMGGSLVLKASYEDRNGRKDSSETTVEFEEGTAEFFANNGIRKGVLLSHYADLLKNWMIDEREHVHFNQSWEPRVDDWVGIPVPPANLGQWERQSMPLAVSDSYRTLFEEFRTHFEQEMSDIGDDTLEQEVAILDILSRK